MQHDILIIKNMTFYAFHGDDIKERELGQMYEVDLELKFDMSKAIKEDNIKYTINYRKVYKLVERIIIGRRFNLIETLAGTIAYECLDNFDIRETKVTVRKLKPPVEGILDYVESIIVRKK